MAEIWQEDPWHGNDHEVEKRKMLIMAESETASGKRQ